MWIFIIHIGVGIVLATIVNKAFVSNFKIFKGLTKFITGLLFFAAAIGFFVFFTVHRMGTEVVEEQTGKLEQVLLANQGQEEGFFTEGFDVSLLMEQIDKLPIGVDKGILGTLTEQIVYQGLKVAGMDPVVAKTINNSVDNNNHITALSLIQAIKASIIKQLNKWILVGRIILAAILVFYTLLCVKLGS